MRMVYRSAALAALLGGCLRDHGFTGIAVSPGVGISADLTTVGIARGQELDVTLTVSRVQFAGPIDLSVSGLAAGITPTLTPATVPADLRTAVLTLTVSNTAALGSTTALIHAKGGSVTEADLTITIVVNP